MNAAHNYHNPDDAQHRNPTHNYHSPADDAQRRNPIKLQTSAIPHDMWEMRRGSPEPIGCRKGGGTEMSLCVGVVETILVPVEPVPVAVEDENDGVSVGDGEEERVV